MFPPALYVRAPHSPLPHLITLGAPSYTSNWYFSFSKVRGKTSWPCSWETCPLRLPPGMPWKISHHSLCRIVTRAGEQETTGGLRLLRPFQLFIHLRRCWPGVNISWRLIWHKKFMITVILEVDQWTESWGRRGGGLTDIVTNTLLKLFSSKHLKQSVIF